MLKEGFHWIIIISVCEFVLTVGQQQTVAEPLAFVYDDGEGNTMCYRLSLPPDFSPEMSYPLVLYMHGAGDRGSNNTSQLNGINSLIEATQSEAYASYLLAPQLPAGMLYSSDLGYNLIVGVLNEVVVNYPVDSSRIYVTGYSAGGTGTFVHLHDSDRFAVGVPIASGINGITPELAAELAPGYRDTPMWVFHGALDTLIPVEKARIFVDAIRAAGGSVLYTEYPDRGHGILSYVYTNENPGLYNWMFSQQRAALSDIPGDFDLDGTCDGVDFLVWQQGVLPNPLSIADLALWKTHFGETGMVASSNSVPEPTTITILVLFTTVTQIRRFRMTSGATLK